MNSNGDLPTNFHIINLFRILFCSYKSESSIHFYIERYGNECNSNERQKSRYVRGDLFNDLIK